MTDHFKNFTVTKDDRGIIRVALDVPGRPLNVLDHEVMSELDQIITSVENDSDAKLLVLFSAKESGFLAGADVAEIERIDSAERAERLLLQGQLLFERIERLSVKTLAVIHGPCLGGGLELAMACDHRIARNNSSTKIGLPEIKLGLIPGWGGTQRLPKWVGLRKALSMILSGKPLDAGSAYRCGLVDLAIEPDHWRDSVRDFAEKLVSSGDASVRSRRTSWADWLMDENPIGRSLVFAATRKRLAKEFRHYPALDSAIKSIAAGFSNQRNGFATEREEFGRLIGTPTCRSLIKLFFARERARKLSTWSPEAARAVHHDPIQGLGVIGAGAMGAGIGHVSATRGFDVVLKEVDCEAVEVARERMNGLIDDYAHHKRLGRPEIDALRSRISLTDGWDTLRSRDLIVEAVVERMDVKQSVLTELENRVPRSAILATNTSSLSVTEMASCLEHPERFAGLHFFNPVRRMELVEVVRGEQTNDTTIAQLVSFVRALGKTPVVTSDSPGFLVNRILFPYLGEAILMTRDGYETGLIDKEIRRFGMPMGPLELLDRVGLDVALHVAKSLRSVLVDVDGVIDTLVPMVVRGDLGRKSGRGFYDYSKRRKQALILDETPAMLPDPAICKSDGLTDIQRRLVYPMLAESMRCREERVVADSWMIDLAMVLGTGFAPHRGGPISVIDSIGWEMFRDNLMSLRDCHGIRFQPPTMHKQNESDHPKAGSS